MKMFNWSGTRSSSLLPPHVRTKIEKVKRRGGGEVTDVFAVQLRLRNKLLQSGISTFQ